MDIAVMTKLIWDNWHTLLFYFAKEHNLYFWGFEGEKKLYVFGPLHAEPLSFTQERHFLHQRKIRRKDFPLKELTLAESLPIISLVYYCLTGKQYDMISDLTNWQNLGFVFYNGIGNSLRE